MRVFLVFLVSCWFLGCGEKPNPTPPDSVILYSIDGPTIHDWEGDEDPREGLTPDQIFHHYPILGQVDLTGTDTGKRLADIMELQHHKRGVEAAACFIPRHGLRVVRGDTTTDYVICFQCHQYYWYIDQSAQRNGEHTIPESRAESFTTPLTAAGIELAP